MAKDSITVRLIRFDPRGEPAECRPGFLHLWALYVRGFNPRYHCQRCLRGRLSAQIKTRFTPDRRLLTWYWTKLTPSTRFTCAASRVAIGHHEATITFPFPLVQDIGSFEQQTYNKGYIIKVTNAGGSRYLNCQQVGYCRAGRIGSLLQLSLWCLPLWIRTCVTRSSGLEDIVRILRMRC